MNQNINNKRLLNACTSHKHAHLHLDLDPSEEPKREEPNQRVRVSDKEPTKNQRVGDILRLLASAKLTG